MGIRNHRWITFADPAFFFLAAAAAVTLFSGRMAAQDSGSDPVPDLSRLPAAAEKSVVFHEDIKPILEKHCLRCHGPERPKSGFRLDTREAAMRGGDWGVNIVEGRSEESNVVLYSAHLIEDMEMPPSGKGDRLTDVEIGLLRAWIDQGVDWTDPTGDGPATEIAFEPAVQFITVDGNERVFREHWWGQEGWVGGVNRLNVRHDFDSETRLQLEAYGAFPDDRSGFRLGLRRRDLGYVEAGFEQFRRYTDDLGGYAPGLTMTPLSLDRDLSIDHGRAWVDLGLTLPDWPDIGIGYEYTYKDGEKAIQQWGSVPVPGGGGPLSVSPARKEIDERTHIVKLDLEHEISGMTIEDRFRAEFHDQDNRRVTYDFSPATPLRTDEGYDHFMASNSFRAEKQVRPWWLLSGGYFFSHLDGGAGFSQSSFFGDVASLILLKRQAHVFNLNQLLGPWKGLSLTAGLQSEWTRQEGFGNGQEFSFTPIRFQSDLDSASIEESVGIRYTSIPWTVLHADARLRQESVGHYESSAGAFGDRAFLRDTDASSELRDYRIGFTVSPWSRVSWKVSYRHRLSEHAFDHLTDMHLGGGPPGNGYPAFLRAREIEGDEVELKWTVRILGWWKATIGYEIIASDYRNDTDPVTAGGAGAPSPGGSLFTGNYDAHLYSLHHTFTPWHRLYLDASFLYSESRMVTAVNGRSGVVPYEGDTYQAMMNTTFVADEKTDLIGGYSFTRTDYGKNNRAAALPLGVEYELHGLTAGIRRKLRDHVSTTIRYGFFYYDEPTSGGARDYLAHGIFGNLTMRFP